MSDRIHHWTIPIDQEASLNMNASTHTRTMLTRTQVALILLLLLIFGITTGVSTNPPRPPEPRESFMLAYIDNNERIRVRYSNDGVTWNAASLSGAIADAGVGAGASSDNVGLSTILSHGGAIARLHLRFGVGADNWDGTDRRYDAISPRRRPTIVNIGNNHYLIAFLQNDEFRIVNYDHSQSTFADITPTPAPAGLQNNGLHNSPAMAYRDGRVVLSWMRHEQPGNPSPRDVQVLGGDVNQSGQVTWTNTFTLSLRAMSRWSAHKILAEPSLSSNRNAFSLSIMHAWACPERGCFATDECFRGAETEVMLWTSDDGYRWYEGTGKAGLKRMSPYDPPLPEVQHTQICREVFVEGVFEIAHGCENSVAVFMFPPTKGGNRIYRRGWNPETEWQEITAASVFGAQIPEIRQFSLITMGRSDWSACPTAARVSGTDIP